MSEPITLRVGPGAYTAISEAIAHLPPDDGTPARILIAPGVYREKIVLSRSHTTMEGEDAQHTVIAWDDAAFALLEDGMRRGTFRTATLRTDGAHITLRRLTIRNDAAPREAAGQAIALYADGDHFLCEDCVLLGHQDTLFTAPLPPKEMQKNGFIGPKQFAPRIPQRQTYRRCRIEGDVDFIFGSAAAWFDRCDIVSVDGRGDRTQPMTAYVTAASTPEGQAYGYVFDRCRFAAVGCPDGSIYLGRPWREYAKTVLLHCELGAHIRPEGFHDWDKPHAHSIILYAEYGSTGPGAQGERAPFARRLTDDEAEEICYEDFLRSLD
ncbi:MAG: pectin methylesterase [Clostridia bacterium]|nr:pectin methylesterase [Clostridia bacterium]